MIKIQFTFLIFQNNQLDEELKSFQEFIDINQLIKALIKFSAQESPLRSNSQVTKLYGLNGCNINLPKTKLGYKEDTYVIIKEANILGN